MLDKIREGAQGPWAMVVIALIVLSFVFAGVGSYLTGSTQTAVASVNGVEIQQNTLERAYQAERNRLESQFGEGVAALFANPEYLQDFRQGVLDRLIGEELVEQKAQALGLRVSDDQIRDTIRAMPEFQVGAQFNNERYQAIIQQAGFQPNSFRDYMRAEMTRDQLARALAGSEFTLPGEVERANLLQSQTRNIEVVTIAAQPFADAIELSEDDINAFYQSNLNTYDTEEKVALAYVELRVADLAGEVDVTEDEILEYYTQNQASYMTEEERRVSHIMVELSDDEAAAEAEAMALLARVQAGEDFAALAEAESDDIASAELGGDLDFFGRDIMEPAFEEAAFALDNVGDVTELVKTDFGFHIIKLTDIKPEDVTPLVEVQEDIRLLLETDKATGLFYARQQDMAQLAFELPDTLVDVAGAIGAEVKTTELFTQGAAPAAVNYPQVLAVAFSSDIINDGVNSDVIQISDEHVMVVRAEQYEPQRTKSLEEVRTEIEMALRAERAQQEALAFADDLMAKVIAEESIDTELSDNGLQWEAFNDLTRMMSTPGLLVVEQAFTLGLEQGENVTTVAKNNGDVALVKLLSVESPTEIDEAQLDALRQRLTSTYSQTNYAAFVEALRAEADVQVFAR
ncbi:SurA N-terminal domain-containing protein [Alteromonas sp. ASW11-36]|uniref:Periplasmic chaperone PpiD n=1 Tax=Alteromonas arenosi TaxID=3055817 RepID=A0ABT7SU63_9ALTE|nr:SurA N-terminal domain-containing protein [Alteromonas sp. ASW11-36]MDM7859728.1 SurA N-terminal domain-containing protein [Alteromonas sp. ASW11-36]